MIYKYKYLQRTTYGQIITCLGTCKEGKHESWLGERGGKGEGSGTAILNLSLLFAVQGFSSCLPCSCLFRVSSSTRIFSLLESSRRDMAWIFLESSTHFQNIKHQLCCLSVACTPLPSFTMLAAGECIPVSAIWDFIFERLYWSWIFAISFLYNLKQTKVFITYLFKGWMLLENSYLRESCRMKSNN